MTGEVTSNVMCFNVTDRTAEIERLLREFLGTTDLDEAEQHAIARESDWLKILHTSKLEQHLADQGRIWIAGAIFLPLSLAPFTVFAIRRSVSLSQVILAALGSLLLLLAWHLMARWMQWHADRNLDWVRGVRREVGIGRSTRDDEPMTQWHLRTLLVWCVATAWLVVGVLAATHRL